MVIQISFWDSRFGNKKILLCLMSVKMNCDMLETRTYILVLLENPTISGHIFVNQVYVAISEMSLQNAYLQRISLPFL